MVAEFYRECLVASGRLGQSEMEAFFGHSLHTGFDRQPKRAKFDRILHSVHRSSVPPQGHHPIEASHGIKTHNPHSPTKRSAPVQHPSAKPPTNPTTSGKPIRTLPKETKIYIQGSASDLYTRIASESKFSLHRLRISKTSDGKAIPNDKSVTVASLELKDGDGIAVKDLGTLVPGLRRPVSGNMY
jgi:hypothetical protein